MVETIPTMIKLDEENNGFYKATTFYKDKKLISFRIAFDKKIDKKFIIFRTDLNINVLSWKHFLLRETTRSIKKFLNLTIHEIKLDNNVNL